LTYPFPVHLRKKKASQYSNAGDESENAGGQREFERSAGEVERKAADLALETVWFGHIVRI
jgi:hypothetical protein